MIISKLLHYLLKMDLISKANKHVNYCALTFQCLLIEKTDNPVENSEQRKQ